MKTNALILIAVLAAGPAWAQTSPKDSDAPTKSSESESSNSSDAMPVYSFDEVAGQLHELSAAVQNTLPMLEEATQAETNAVSGKSTGGVLAGVLGNILRGNTNQSASSRNAGQTNALGQILRGVLGTNSVASISTNSIEADLILLRDQLQTIVPVLERLEAADLGNLDRSSTNNLAPTGRDEDRN